ncbi:glycosyltransferase [Alkalilacustris brevis]|uniref:glycosyltransferase n=1 Tax=Alkalilacustris brevis TaxID=2026338 RepID=UPI000E0DAE17|nr:glycosyltransferase [Alkalilacustris brevis]
MIPKLIHQTWRDHDIPGPSAWPESWKRLNPAWEYRFWTDEDLLELVRQHYPQLEALYQSYPKPVQRADMGRYLILHHCGGVYADIDTECLAPFDPIAQDSRVILAEEPAEHRNHSQPLGLERLFFNGLMASPRGHRFWDHVLEVMERCRHAAGTWVLESTGPLMLTGVVESYPRPEELSLNSCHLFAPVTNDGCESLALPKGDYAGLRLASHHWQGSWLSAPRRKPGTVLKAALRRARYRLTRGKVLGRADLRVRVDQSLLHTPIQPGAENVAVMIPVRDAAPFLDRCFELLRSLDHPPEKLKLVFCEGDSRDDTATRLKDLAQTHAGHFRDICLTTLNGGAPLKRSRRWKPRLQYARRAHLARVRNHLLDYGLDAQDDWVLWIDADVCDYAPATLRRLLDARCKVVTPDCVQEWDGPSFDLNAFLEDRKPVPSAYYKHVRGGLYMPPKGLARRYLHDLRFLDRVPLSSVGGTMLLVHAAVHRAGLRFPEIPYDDLLETEGFGRACRDLGVQPWGLSNLQIRHVRS